MKRDAAFFGEAELELVQTSRRLKEALAVETALSSEGVDYLVSAERYAARFLLVFPAERVGAFFYVPAPEAARVRDLLRERGFMVVEVE